MAAQARVRRVAPRRVAAAAAGPAGEAAEDEVHGEEPSSRAAQPGAVDPQGGGAQNRTLRTYQKLSFFLARFR